MRSARGWAPWAVAAGAVALLMAVAGRYGWHRDELYFFEAGERLSWAYVDFPPVVAVVARIARDLFGASLVGLRLFPALAVGAVVVLAAQMASTLGGGRRARALAAMTTALTPIFLGVGHLLSAATFEVLAWALVTALVLRLLDGGDERWWLAVGVVVGLGFLAKHSMLFLVVALAASIWLVGRRSVLRSRWLVAGAGAALALALPNVLWHASHDWPVLDMMRSLSAESENADSLLFLPAQVGMTGFAAVVWIPGLAWLLRSEAVRPWRAVGVAYLLLAGLFAVTAGKPYYLAGAYPVLISAGAVWWERRQRFVLPASLVGLGVLAIPFALPVAPAEWVADLPSEDLELEFGAQLGWRELVDEVEIAYRSLEHEGWDPAIVTSNYGEAGAVDLYGPDLGLPAAHSRHNHYWLWGPPEGDEDSAVLVGFPEREVRRWFSDCSPAWSFRTPHGVASEEEGAAVWACVGQRRSWEAVWPEIKKYSA